MHTWKTKDGWNSSSWPDQNDSSSDVTTWNYEAATGLLLSKEDAAGKKVSYTYGAGGKLLTRTWARASGSGSIDSIVTTYGYDDATGDLTGINYSDDTPDITFAYNRAGSQTTITDALGTRQFAYNSSLQQISESMSGMVSSSLSRSYDTLGRASGVSTGSVYSVTYGYGSDGRLSNLSWKAAGAQESAAYGYLAGSSLLSSVTFGSGSATNYTYEPHRNLKTEVENLYGATSVSKYSYTYDAISRRTSMKTAGDVFSATTTTAAPDVAPDIEVDLSQSSQIDYTSNSLNQYTEIDRDGKVSSPSYDDDGNMTDDGTRVFTWNGENRLVSAAPKTPADGDEKAEFVYDYMGRRVKKSVYLYDSGKSPAWQLEKYILFVYDGWNLIRDITVDSGAESNSYFVWGLDLSGTLQGAGGVGGLLASVDSSATAYSYLYDANGNVTQVVKSSDGSVAAHYEYDPYGNLTASHGEYAAGNTFRFSTKYKDDETGLIYYGFRYYDPEIGRWMSRDPLNESGSMILRKTLKMDNYNYKSSFGQKITDLYTAMSKDIIRNTNNSLQINNHFSDEMLDIKFLFNNRISNINFDVLYIYVENNPLMKIDPIGMVSTTCDCDFVRCYLLIPPNGYWCVAKVFCNICNIDVPAFEPQGIYYLNIAGKRHITFRCKDFPPPVNPSLPPHI